MSQNPYPYQPYGGAAYYAPNPGDVLGPAKRAGLMMIIVGGIGTLGGLCFVGLGAVFSMLAGNAEFQQKMAEMEAQNHLTQSQVQGIMLVMGFIMLGVALANFILGFFVRRGGMAPIVTGLVITALVCILVLFNTVAELVMGSVNPAGICMGVAMLGAFGGQGVLLIQALRAVGHVTAMRQQAAMYGAYGQQAAGYGYPQQQPNPYGYGPPGATPAESNPPPQHPPPPPPPDSAG